LDFLGHESRSDPNGTRTTVGFDGLNVGNELTVVGAVIHAITLEEGEKFF